MESTSYLGNQNRAKALFWNCALVPKHLNLPLVAVMQSPHLVYTKVLLQIFLNTYIYTIKHEYTFIYIDEHPSQRFRISKGIGLYFQNLLRKLVLLILSIKQWVFLSLLKGWLLDRINSLKLFCPLTLLNAWHLTTLADGRRWVLLRVLYPGTWCKA